MKPIFLRKDICPQCSNEMPVYQDEVCWCKYCDWNLLVQDHKELSIFDMYYRDLGKSIGENLFDSVLNRVSIRPHWSFAKFFTLAISLSVVLIPYFMLLISVLAYIYLPVLVFIIITIFTLGLVYVYFSSGRKIPKDDLPREEFPLLYGLVGRISREIAKTHITQLHIISDFNAFYTEFGVGFFKKRHISIGLPLVEILEPDEFVALISHEVSHGANGDLMRSSLIHKSHKVLENIFYFLRPQNSYEGISWGDPQLIFIMIGNKLGFFLSCIPLGLYKLMTKLYTRDSQEAEYYADIMASKVCGKQALVNLLKKLRYVSNFHTSVSKVSLSKNSLDFFEELKKSCEVEKSENDLLRLNRIEILQGLSLDATHPPTDYRIKFAQAKAQELPSILINEVEFRSIKEELFKLKKKLSNDLIDDYVNKLYYS